jgi:hypothetical protein
MQTRETEGSEYEHRPSGVQSQALIEGQEVQERGCKPGHGRRQKQQRGHGRWPKCENEPHDSQHHGHGDD